MYQANKASVEYTKRTETLVELFVLHSLEQRTLNPREVYSYNWWQQVLKHQDLNPAPPRKNKYQYES